MKNNINIFQARVVLTPQKVYIHTGDANFEYILWAIISSIINQLISNTDLMHIIPHKTKVFWTTATLQLSYICHCRTDAFSWCPFATWSPTMFSAHQHKTDCLLWLLADKTVRDFTWWYNQVLKLTCNKFSDMHVLCLLFFFFIQLKYHKITN